MLEKKKERERVSTKPPVRTLQKPKQAKFGLNKIKTAPELVTYLRVYWYSLQASSSKSFMTENKENDRKLFWCTKDYPSHLIFRHLCLSHLAMKICRGPRDWEPWGSLCARDSSRKHWCGPQKVFAVLCNSETIIYSQFNKTSVSAQNSKTLSAACAGTGVRSTKCYTCLLYTSPSPRD